MFQKNYEQYLKKGKRVVINEGGTGSSKTISLAQLFAQILITEKNVELTIARKTFPSLRATAMKDFIVILKDMGVYRAEWHNKSENIFKYPPTGSTVDFVSVDDPSKIRSRKRHYLWMNEGNEFDLEDWRQLSMRTSKQIFFDYNPSHQFHWIYDQLEPRKDCVIIRSSYKDNPFLADDIVSEIEGYKKLDENYWRIYGLGLRGLAEALIFTHWEYCEELPKNYDKVFYGLDFGYNNPSAMIKVVEKDKEFYLEEKLYQTRLTNTDLIDKLKTMGIGEDEIYPDMAEPARLEELRRAGFNVMDSDKSIKNGIDFIKSRKIYVTKSSLNLIKELRSYSWKTKDERLLDDPIKDNDHLIDAGRYAMYSSSKNCGYGLEWL